MATLALNYGGQALGGFLGLGSFGTRLLQGAGLAAGAYIDMRLFGPGSPDIQGPRLDDTQLSTATEGNHIQQVWGRMRVAGQLIWAAQPREVADSEDVGGGKGTGGGGTVTSYTYFQSFAVGLCEGLIQSIGRIWLDGEELDFSTATIRTYTGSETQDPDPKIQSIEGSAYTPAFRGLAYLVFEDFNITAHGNRIPTITVEVYRRADSSYANLEEDLKAFTIIPASGEFAYGTTHVYIDSYTGLENVTENQHSPAGVTNWIASMDQLQNLAPNLEAMNVVVAWHGTDLRIGECEIQPRVEAQGFETADSTRPVRNTEPYEWRVSNLTRNSSGIEVVSSDDNGALIGGTIADRAVYEAMVDLKDRDIRIMFYPFILMDIPADNTLPNPYSNNAGTSGQPVYPWRGRITQSPAAGFTGSPDKTSAAKTQVDAFFGAATPNDFGWDDNLKTVTYSGPNEWSYRRFILHYAKLCAEVGGVDSFCIGTEMPGMTTIRDGATSYPAIDALIDLADDVRTILGPTVKIGYAADWSEYHSHRPTDGSNDVIFNMDPLWAHDEIDFIGIDNYLPLSDWRDGTGHDDYGTGAGQATTLYDVDYLKANVEAGEYYDWYYADSAARSAQTRTTIQDGDAANEPWIYRQKDIKNWWLNDHHNRPGGTRDASATDWVPESKPIWFTEYGCPAVDKGTNQPNVFYDPKSSESFFPYFSNGQRDDFIQRLYLQAMVEYWDPDNGNNPTSSEYSAPMVDTSNMYVWTWDSRPYPQFPNLQGIWRDFGNWERGHWMTGRLGNNQLAAVVDEIANGWGVTVDVSDLEGSVTGYRIDRAMSVREALVPLQTAYAFDIYESGDVIKCVHRGKPSVKTYTEDDLIIDQANQSPFRLIRGQETEIPEEVVIRFPNENKDYKVSTANARRLRGYSQERSESDLAIVSSQAFMQSVAEMLLVDAWIMRERTGFMLPPSALALEPTDVITISARDIDWDLRIQSIGFEGSRPVEAVRTVADVYNRVLGPSVSTPTGSVSTPTGVALHIMDLPILTETQVEHGIWYASAGSPWRGTSVYRSNEADTSFTKDIDIENIAQIGVTAEVLASGPTSRWDLHNTLVVQVSPIATLASKSELAVLNGANVGAIYHADTSEWEIIQWVNATLLGNNTYRLSKLLRGQRGTENAISSSLPAGAPFIILNSSLTQSRMATTQFDRLNYFKYGPQTKLYTDSTYKDTTFTPTFVALRPFSPVHVEGEVQDNGDLQISWVRRTRLLQGDNWSLSEVPLGEETEEYELEILDGSTVVRTVTGLTSPTYTYTAAMQTTDFGSAQTSVKVRIYQMGQLGRGAVSEVTT